MEFDYSIKWYWKLLTTDVSVMVTARAYLVQVQTDIHHTHQYTNHPVAHWNVQSEVCTVWDLAMLGTSDKLVRRWTFRPCYCGYQPQVYNHVHLKLFDAVHPTVQPLTPDNHHTTSQCIPSCPQCRLCAARLPRDWQHSDPWPIERSVEGDLCCYQELFLWLTGHLGWILVLYYCCVQWPASCNSLLLTIRNTLHLPTNSWWHFSIHCHTCIWCFN